MTYSAAEVSVESGAPVELYEFNFGPVYYRYTSAASPIDYLGRTFAPLTLTRQEITDTGTPENTSLAIEMFRNTAVCDLFRIQPPSAVVSITIYRGHVTDGAGEFVVAFIGRVLDMEFNGNKAKLNCEPIFTAMQRLGLRRNYQVSCPYAVYGVGCNLSAASFALPSSNFSVNGAVVFVQGADTQPDNWWAGGYIEYTHVVTGLIETRSIRTSSAGYLTLSLPPDGLAGAPQVKVYPGCAHTTSDCLTKFNNLLNYGGQPFIPGTNPFGGARIF